MAVSSFTSIAGRCPLVLLSKTDMSWLILVLCHDRDESISHLHITISPRNITTHRLLEEPRLVASKISATQWIYTPSLPSLCHDTYIVRAMDAYGQESGDADGVNVVAIQ